MSLPITKVDFVDHAQGCTSMPRPPPILDMSGKWKLRIITDGNTCRLMSDYEVTLVNDNSAFCLAHHLCTSCMPDIPFGNTKTICSVHQTLLCEPVCRTELTTNQARILRPLQGARREYASMPDSPPQNPL